MTFPTPENRISVTEKHFSSCDIKYTYKIAKKEINTSIYVGEKVKFFVFSTIYYFQIYF